MGATLSVLHAAAEVVPTLLAATVMTVSGTVDELRGKKAAPRLVWIAVGAAFLGGKPSGWPLSVLTVMALSRAFSVMDRMEGLAAGSAAIISSFIGIHAATTGRAALACLSFALGGAAIGFLPYGYRLRTREAPVPAALGEGGTRFLALTVAALTLSVNWTATGVKDAVVPVLLLAVPLASAVVGFWGTFDWALTTKPDPSSERVLKLGIRRQELVLSLWLGSLCLGCSAFLYRGASLPDALLILGQVVIVLGVSAFAAVVILRRQRGAR